MSINYSWNKQFLKFKSNFDSTNAQPFQLVILSLIGFQRTVETAGVVNNHYSVGRINITFKYVRSATIEKIRSFHGKWLVSI